MSMRVPPIQTERLLIRDFQSSDLDTIHRILDLEIDPGSDISLEQRKQWLQWSIGSYAEHAQLNQPPYGDRAVTLLHTGEVIGATGFSPMFHPLSEILQGKPAAAARWLPEIGLYYALSSAHRGFGYATEAAQALIEYAFTAFNLKRIVANTEFGNLVTTSLVLKNVCYGMLHRDNNNLHGDLQC
jgi:RimJ/RimL family protein N-acetyltransferase